MIGLKQGVMVVLLLLLLNACGNQKTTAKKYHRLAVDISQPAQSQLREDTLVIKRPKALSILGGRPMVATQDDGSLVQLSHHFWLDSPKILLQDILRTWASSQWQTVSYQVPSNQPHQVLDSRILAFEKQQNQANVTIEFLLYNDDYQLISNQTLSQSQTLNGEGYRAYVRASVAAVEAILAELQEQLAHVH